MAGVQLSNSSCVRPRRMEDCVPALVNAQYQMGGPFSVGRLVKALPL